MSDCQATMESQAEPGHVHTCIGYHDDQGYHYCGECKRWWWKR